MSNLDSYQNRWATAIFLTILLAIVILTLAPFSLEGGISLTEITSNFRHRSSVDDWTVNILLYVPFGFSFAAWLWTLKVSQATQFTCVFLCAFSLSATVEILQVFLPSRVPASTDIYANCVGGILGFQCFNRWGQNTTFDIFISIQVSIQRFIQQKIASLPIQNLMLILISYVLMLFLISNSLQAAIHFDNWTQPYFLLLGTDQAVGQAWRGYISEVFIADQAVSEKDIAQIFTEKGLPPTLQNSLIASYDLTAQRDNYPDQIGHSPKLIWRGEPTQPTGKNGSLIDSNQWLETKTPASFINQSLNKSSQFTLSTILATANLQQAEPTPIVSLSNQSTERRNFAFAQDGENLVLWLRTSVTGDRGTRPELVIPNVFTDTDFHHLIITYNNSVLRVYIDKLQNQLAFELNPGVVIFQKLLPLEKLKNTGLVVCKVLYYCVLFIPLGILTGLILALTKRRLAYRIVLVAESVLLAPLLLEALLVLKSDREFSLMSFSLSAGIMASTISGLFLCRKL